MNDPKNKPITTLASNRQPGKVGAPLRTLPPNSSITLDQYNTECALAEAHDLKVQKERFLALYLETGNASHCCRELGIVLTTVDKFWMVNDPEFIAAYKEIKVRFETIGAADREAKRQLFLDLFAKTGNFTRSCKEAGFLASTVWKWLEREPEFSERYETAKAEAADAIEEALRERAINGVVIEHPDFTETKYSDNGAIFLLKGQKREKYGDKVETEIKGKIDINVTASVLAKAIVEERMKALEAPVIDIKASNG